MQKNNAKQNAIGIGGLRGGEPSYIAKNVFTKMGIHFYASGSTKQSR